MATINLKLLDTCSGGGHLTIQLTLGARVRDIHVVRDEILSTVQDDELEAAFKVLMRIYAGGKTLAQVRDGLVAGVNVVVP